MTGGRHGRDGLTAAAIPGQAPRTVHVRRPVPADPARTVHASTDPDNASPPVLALLALSGPAAAQAGKAEAPIPAATLALMAQKGVTAASPVLFRAYKKESEIEVWKKGPSGYVFIKTFPICRWSGQLGPKRKSGDRQTPEGFYTVPRRQMNPNSHYYLSFDVGYPNAYDRAHGGTGSAVMVHGICSSMGCFAMTDGTVGEIYAIARDALNGGQAAFQFQSYPFRMSAENMARHRDRPEHRVLARAQGRLRPVRGEPGGAPGLGGRRPLRLRAVPEPRASRRRSPPAGPWRRRGSRRSPRPGSPPCAPPTPTAARTPSGRPTRPGAARSATSAGRRRWPSPGRRWWSCPATASPRPVPESVWAAWAAPDSVAVAAADGGLRPGLRARAPDPFGALAARLPTRYGDGLPSLAGCRPWRPGSPAARSARRGTRAPGLGRATLGMQRRPDSGPSVCAAAHHDGLRHTNSWYGRG